MEFRVLGPLEVSEEGRQIALGGLKQRALLALLLLHANEVVSRDRLIDELWQEDPPETARTALQVHISQLRKALGRERIVTQAPGYRVVVGPGELDSERFEQLVARDGSDAEALRDALDLWRGPPLAELGEGFAPAERGRLEEERVLALERRIDADLALGRHAALVPELEELAREHPLREHPRCQLMLALYRCGRQAEALEVYRRGRRLLADELGLEPGEALRDLERAILSQDEALAAPAAPEAARPAAAARGRRWLVVAGLGVVLIVAAATAGIVLATRGSSPVPVRPNSVAAVDTRSGKVVADVPIGGSPIALALGAGSVWAVDGDHSTVSRIDARTKERVPIGGLGSDVKELTFGFGSLWVAGGNDGTVMRVDPRDDGIQPVDLGSSEAVFSVRVGEGAVWAMRGNDVLRIDPRRNVADGRVRVKSPLGIALGLGSLWVTTLDERILRVDVRRLKPIYVQDVGRQAYFPVVARHSLWAIVPPLLPSEVPEVWRLDTGTLTQTSSLRFPKAFPYQLTSGDGALWWVDPVRRGVFRVEPRPSLAAERVARLPYHPVAAVVNGRAAWIGVQAQPLD
jgi:DNA-binding SARP family transcriptional activator